VAKEASLKGRAFSTSVLRRGLDLRRIRQSNFAFGAQRSRKKLPYVVVVEIKRTNIGSSEWPVRFTYRYSSQLGVYRSSSWINTIVRIVLIIQNVLTAGQFVKVEKAVSSYIGSQHYTLKKRSSANDDEGSSRTQQAAGLSALSRFAR
jgi:hypothetical protein